MILDLPVGAIEERDLSPLLLQVAQQVIEVGGIGTWGRGEEDPLESAALSVNAHMQFETGEIVVGIRSRAAQFGRQG